MGRNEYEARALQTHLNRVEKSSFGHIPHLEHQSKACKVTSVNQTHFKLCCEKLFHTLAQGCCLPMAHPSYPGDRCRVLTRRSATAPWSPDNSHVHRQQDEALCFTHSVPARSGCVCPLIAVRSSSESWALYDSISMTGLVLFR